MTSPSTSASKSVTASCPGRKRFVASGMRVTGALGQVLVTGVVPDAGLTSVTVRAAEDETGVSASWTVSAYAVCANPLPGLERVQGTGVSDSMADRVQAAACPAGKGLLGTSGEIVGATGHVVLDSFYYDAELTSAGAGASEDRTGTPAAWSLRAYAICADETELTAATVDRGVGSGIAASLVCPSGQTMTGVGGDLIGAAGRTTLVALVPGDPGSVVGEANPNQTFDGWGLTYQRICTTTVSGMQIVTASSPSGGAASKWVTVGCPTGTKVLGGGGAFVTGDRFPPGLVLESIVPNEMSGDVALSRTRVTGFEDKTDFAGAWSLTAYAICVSR